MNEVRIDKWMWAMRIFKTRTIATDACKKGRVLMGGVAVKPSRTIKEGDIINVRKRRSPTLSASRLWRRTVLEPNWCRNIWRTSRQRANLISSMWYAYQDSSTAAKVSDAPPSVKAVTSPNSPIPSPTDGTSTSSTMTTNNAKGISSEFHYCDSAGKCLTLHLLISSSRYGTI